MASRFEKGAEMPHEHAVATRALIDEIAPKMAGQPFEVVGSVVMSLASVWLMGFKQPKHRKDMAHALSEAVLAVGAIEDDEPAPTVQ